MKIRDKTRHCFQYRGERNTSSVCLPSSWPLCVGGLLTTRQNTIISARVRGEKFKHIPLSATWQIASFHPPLSQISFPYSAKDSQSPDSSRFFSHSSKEAARDVRTSITCLFTFGWHSVDPWRTYTERAAKKSPPPVGPFPMPIDYPWAINPLWTKCNFCINEPIMRSAVREWEK